VAAEPGCELTRGPGYPHWPKGQHALESRFLDFSLDGPHAGGPLKEENTIVILHESGIRPGTCTRTRWWPVCASCRKKRRRVSAGRLRRTTDGLLALRAWLRNAGARHLADEATRVYWTPLMADPQRGRTRVDRLQCGITSRTSRPQDDMNDRDVARRSVGVRAEQGNFVLDRRCMKFVVSLTRTARSCVFARANAACGSGFRRPGRSQHQAHSVIIDIMALAAAHHREAMIAACASRTACRSRRQADKGDTTTQGALRCVGMDG